MNFFLIHGDDADKSTERLFKFVSEAKKRSWEVIYLDESDQSLKDNLLSESLFGETRFFIHRNIKNISQADLDYLSKIGKSMDGNFVFYSNTPLLASLIKKLPKETKKEEFKLPVLIWNFLDNIYPGNAKNSLKTLHTILETEPAEKILGLISWHLRDLYWVKTEPENFTNKSWRFGKLKAQAAKFKNMQLAAFIEGLSKADVSSKTTQTKLSDTLDLLFAEKLE